MVTYAVRQSLLVRPLVPILLFILLSVFYPHEAGAWNGGEASAEVSGFQIRHQSFHLSPEDPSKVDSLVLDIEGRTRPNRVQVKMGDHGTWFDCLVTPTGTPNRSSALCEIGGMQIDSLLELRVVATGG